MKGWDLDLEVCMEGGGGGGGGGDHYACHSEKVRG